MNSCIEYSDFLDFQCLKSLNIISKETDICIENYSFENKIISFFIFCVFLIAPILKRFSGLKNSYIDETWEISFQESVHVEVASYREKFSANPHIRYSDVVDKG